MIRTLIADDEKPARDELRWLLEKEKDIEVCGEAANGMEVLEQVEQDHPDLILLDIQMPGMSGLETAAQLMSLPRFPQIIFVTAYDQFAIEAFDVNAVDYLLKPVEQSRLDRALNRIRNRLNSDDQDLEKRILNLLKPLKAEQGKAQAFRKLTVYEEDHFVPLDFADIVMVAADGRQSLVYAGNRSYSYRTGLRELETLLQEASLFKCHRSFSINPRFIERIEPWFNSSYKIKMKGVDELIPVSRSYTSELKKLLNMD
ncbi:MAG: response regulator [Spirochaetales bacterium]|nr:response regulator [Spirochaetales bacterium]